MFIIFHLSFFCNLGMRDMLKGYNRMQDSFMHMRQ